MKLIRTLLLISLTACEGSGNFNKLEEKKAVTKDQTTTVTQTVTETQNTATGDAPNAPILTSESDKKIVAGASFALDMNNERTGNDVGMTYVCRFDRTADQRVDAGADCNTLPGGAVNAFNEHDGTLTWTPTGEDIGDFELQIQGSNESGTDQKTFTLTVIEDKRPHLTPVIDQIIEVGQSVHVDVNDVKTGKDDSLSYQCFFDQTIDGAVSADKACKTLPGAPDIKFDAQAGMLVWQPGSAEIGLYEFKIVGKNTEGEGTALFRISVTAARGAEIIRLSEARDLIGTVGETVNVDINNTITGNDEGVTYSCFADTAVDGSVAQLTSCDSLPGTPASKFDSKTGILVWTPSAAASQIDYELMVLGSKGGATDRQVFVVGFTRKDFGEIGNSALTYSPRSWDFGNVAVNSTSASKLLSITNTAASDIFLGQLTIPNEHFHIDFTSCPTPPQPLKAGASCALSIAFQPHVASQLGASLVAKFGKTATSTLEFEADAGVSGTGVGQLTFPGLTQITGITHNHLSLVWDRTPDAVSFIVFRVSGSGDLQYVETLLNASGNVTGKTYTGLIPSTSYTYRVRATDAFGNVDSNAHDVTATTLANRLPALASAADQTAFGGRTVDPIDFNDHTTGTDVDVDGDVITYVCRFDKTVDGSVGDAGTDCASLQSEGGGTASFNRFTGVLSGWRPKYTDVGTSFEIEIVAQDFYLGTASTHFKVDILPGTPLITAVGDRVFPSGTIGAGETVNVDLDNTRFTPATDEGMSYTCTFKRLTVAGGETPSNCTTLPGTASFDATLGKLAWTPNTTAPGAYELTFTGTNGAGSHSRTAIFDVRRAADRSDLVIDLDPRYADSKRPGQNAPSFTSALSDLSTSGEVASLTNFSSASAWAGTGTPTSPVRLVFDGIDDHVDFGTSLGAESELMFETWVFPDLTTKYEQTIFSYGDASGHGLTLSNLGLSQGDASQTYSAAVLADAPTVYWRLNDATGGSFADSSGHNYTGTIINATNAQSGLPPALHDPADRSARFDVNSYISTSIDINGTWTDEAWFQYPFPNNCVGSWCTMTRGLTTDHQIIVSATLKLGSYDQATSFRDSGYSMATLTPGWHHIAAVAQSNVTTFYIDGAAVGTIPWASSSDISAVGNQPSGGQAWGNIDEYALYPTALSATRIKAHYDAGTKSKQSCEARLPGGYWHHVAGLVSQSAQTMQVFIDGTERCNVSIAGFPTLAGSAAALKIGRSSSTTSWKGKIGELRFVSPGSVARIQADYAATKAEYSPQLPLPVKGLKLFLNADQGVFQDTGSTTTALADGDPVARWVDQSGLGTDLTAASNGARPLLRKSILNGHDVLNFDGVDDRLGNTINYYSPYTIFLVARMNGATKRRILDSSPSTNWLLGWQGGNEDVYHAGAWVKQAGSAAVSGAWRQYTGDYSTLGIERIFRNGSLIGSNNTGITGPNGLGVGGGGFNGEYSSCDVAALIVYNRILSASEQQAVEAYLNAMYAVY